MTTAQIPAMLLKLSESAIELARQLLGDGAKVQDVENTALGLMVYLPAAELARLHKRSAAAVHARRRDARKKR